MIPLSIFLLVKNNKKRKRNKEKHDLSMRELFTHKIIMVSWNSEEKKWQN